MTHLQHEILHALRSEPKGTTLTAIQIRKRTSLTPETLTAMIERTEGVRMIDPPTIGVSGKPVFAARWGLSR